MLTHYQMIVLTRNLMRHGVPEHELRAALIASQLELVEAKVYNGVNRAVDDALESEMIQKPRIA